ncbi:MULTISPECIES: GbsR/MarR family transcriptional regulator [unclassified Paenibacillus]|uniref:GbsR/MarR family transcriptional regulator n=1 Tax=unclassified Paenibacillus TaxID=185978 RepID=UPI0036791857
MKREGIGELDLELTPRVQLQRRMIDAIAQTMDLYGANYSFGQLYGIMFFEDRPMTLEEMKHMMSMSKSNMSYGVRSLISSGMVTKLEEKQERKDLYMAETDFFRAFRSFFTMKLQREIDVMNEALEHVLPGLQELLESGELCEDERERCLMDYAKIQHAVEFYQSLQQFVDELRVGDILPYKGGA